MGLGLLANKGDATTDRGMLGFAAYGSASVELSNAQQSKPNTSNYKQDVISGSKSQYAWSVLHEPIVI